MPDIRITLDGYDDVLDWLDRAPEIVLEAAEVAVDRACLYLLDKIPEYPSPPEPGSVVKAMTPKQRRWFFAALREGKIRVPYRRTLTLGRQITHEVQRNPDGIHGEVGAATEYAPWVIGPTFPGEVINGQQMYQAQIHAGRWWQFGQVLDENSDGALQEFETVFTEEFARRTA